jgi:hypothetical protein
LKHIEDGGVEQYWLFLLLVLLFKEEDNNPRLSLNYFDTPSIEVQVLVFQEV